MLNFFKLTCKCKKKSHAIINMIRNINEKYNLCHDARVTSYNKLFYHYYLIIIIRIKIKIMNYFLLQISITKL